jgi:predicted nucleic acid-binding protein
MIVLDEDVAEEPGLRPRELRSEEPFEERHDTNILTYMLDSSDEGKHEKAPETFVGLLRNPGGYAVTAQVVAVFLYVVKRELPEALGDALLLAERLRARGLVLGSYTAEEALKAARHPSGRFWDAPIAYTYLAHGVETVLAENMGDSRG